jgi:hypothetical protein
MKNAAKIEEKEPYHYWQEKLESITEVCVISFLEVKNL